MGAADFALLAPHLEPMALIAGTVLQEPGSDLSQVIFPGRGTVLSLIAVTRDGRVAETAAVGCEGAMGGLLTMQGQTAFCRTVVQVGGAALRIEAAHWRRRRRLRRHPQPDDDLRGRIAGAGPAIRRLRRAAPGGGPVLPLVADHAGSRQAGTIAADPGIPGGHAGGAAHDCVTRVVAGLEQRGLIRNRRSRILVVDRPALEAASCECHQTVLTQFERVAPGLYPIRGVNRAPVQRARTDAGRNKP